MPQEWTKIYQGLGLGKETTSQLQAFRARHTTAVNKNAALKATTPEIDLSHYKSILKDQSAVQNAEKVLREFKPVDYDLSKWNGVVDAFEGKAVSRDSGVASRCVRKEGRLAGLRHVFCTWRLLESVRSPRCAGEEGMRNPRDAWTMSERTYTDTFQVAAAKETLSKISKEESSLKETLSNIQDARPFEDLTVSFFAMSGVAYLSTI